MRSRFLAQELAKRGKYNPKFQALLHIWRVRSDDAGRMVYHRGFGRYSQRVLQVGVRLKTYSDMS